MNFLRCLWGDDERFLLALQDYLYMVEMGGCAQAATGIEHVKLKTSTKMSKSTFLNPVRPDQKTTLVQVKSTSYEIVRDPPKAHCWLHTNVLYMGKRAKHLAIAVQYGRRRNDQFRIGRSGAVIIDIWVLWMSMRKRKPTKLSKSKWHLNLKQRTGTTYHTKYFISDIQSKGCRRSNSNRCEPEEDLSGYLRTK